MTFQEETNFRSVLPHEPLPRDDEGFIHMQGAFEPKKKDPADDGDSYWTNATDLEIVVTEALGERHDSFNLPYPVQRVQVLDTCPPYTKMRLTYQSPMQAFAVNSAWKEQKLTPSQLFASHGDKAFGSHAFQTTLITAEPLPPVSWTRSNPPKFRRLLHGNNDSEERETTRYVFVTGLLEDPNPQSPSFWEHHSSVIEAIRLVFNKYDSTGTGVEVFLAKKKSLPKACHIGMRSPDDCKRVIKELQEQKVEWVYEGAKLQSGNLFLDYASVTQRSLAKSKARSSGEDPEKGERSRPECTSTTDSVHVPGLVLVEDYITKAQEEVLMAILTGPHAPWAPDQTNMSQTGAVKRLVQHYGYVFDYRTADVLRDRSQPDAKCPPMPAAEEKGLSSEEGLVESGRGWEVFASVIERTRQYQFNVNTDDGSTKKASYPHLNQLTVNHYKPGEGIGSHVDTPSAFGDGLISITLNGGIVMEFRKVGDEGLKKLVYLPPRSMILMSGPARYGWEHMIVTRKTDTHNGVVIPRTLRMSLTLRTALKEDDSPLPLVASSKYPPCWGDDQKNSDALVTPATERDHVHAVYDAIATQWHHTRGKRGVLWSGATQFLQQLPPGSLVADVGCGDGKYFQSIWEAGSYVIGTDISLPLLHTALTKSETTPDTRKVSPQNEALRDRPAVAVADCMSVPIRDKCCDAAVCIAVLHHLSTRERRIRCIEELARIVRAGGLINIQAWAMEQEESSRRRFPATDVFVPFNAQPKYLEKVEGSSVTKGLQNSENSVSNSKSVAEMYSEKYTKANFDEAKGLVVFQRYCHLYRKGEMEELAEQVQGTRLIDSGYESGNYFVILEVTE